MHFLGIDLNSGDPIPREWPLLRNVKEPLFLSMLYVLLCYYIGPWIMRKREAFDLRSTLIVYNAFLVSTYVYVLANAFYYLPKLSWKRICGGGTLQPNTIEYKLVCAAYLVYLVKYVEFLDTVFFVLRKKFHLLTKLHIIHHAALPVIGFIVFRTETSGVQAFPVIINSFVHVLMYSYYCLAAMGPRFVKYLWWKRHLTQIQMTQFIVIVLFAVFIPRVKHCRVRTSSSWIEIVTGILFLVLFYNYYYNQHLMKDKKKEAL